MLENFICPDGGLQPVDTCLSGDCRMGERCAPLSYLSLAGKERVWTGKPSTTQLIKGTRQAFLELKCPYNKAPEENAFAILGTGVHKLLEDTEDSHAFNEERVEYEAITGITDRLERQSDGSMVLQDFKVTGSFKIAQLLGIRQEKQPVLNDDGSPVRYKTGAKAGQIKTTNVTVTGEPDYGEWIWQLNFYRLAVINDLGYDVSAIKLFAIVRDGGTYIAQQRGVDKSFYYVDIPILPSDVVMDFFRGKRDDLLGCLQKDTIPKVCSLEETWNGKRCGKYCPVVHHCHALGDNPYL